MEKLLSEAEISVLRKTGTLDKNEIAMRIGDLIVAENVLTKERRIIEVKQQSTVEGRARLLKG